MPGRQWARYELGHGSRTVTTSRNEIAWIGQDMDGATRTPRSPHSCDKQRLQPLHYIDRRRRSRPPARAQVSLHLPHSRATPLSLAPLSLSGYCQHSTRSDATRRDADIRATTALGTAKILNSASPTARRRQEGQRRRCTWKIGTCREKKRKGVSADGLGHRSAASARRENRGALAVSEHGACVCCWNRGVGRLLRGVG